MFRRVTYLLELLQLQVKVLELWFGKVNESCSTMKRAETTCNTPYAQAATPR